MATQSNPPPTGLAARAFATLEILENILGEIDSTGQIIQLSRLSKNAYYLVHTQCKNKLKGRTFLLPSTDPGIKWIVNRDRANPEVVAVESAYKIPPKTKPLPKTQHPLILNPLVLKDKHYGNRSIYQRLELQTDVVSIKPELIEDTTGALMVKGHPLNSTIYNAVLGTPPPKVVAIEWSKPQQVLSYSGYGASGSTHVTDDKAITLRKLLNAMNAARAKGLEITDILIPGYLFVNEHEWDWVRGLQEYPLSQLPTLSGRKVFISNSGDRSASDPNIYRKVLQTEEFMNRILMHVGIVAPSELLKMRLISTTASMSSIIHKTFSIREAQKKADVQGHGKTAEAAKNVSKDVVELQTVREEIDAAGTSLAGSEKGKKRPAKRITNTAKHSVKKAKPDRDGYTLVNGKSSKSQNELVPTRFRETQTEGAREKLKEIQPYLAQAPPGGSTFAATAAANTAQQKKKSDHKRRQEKVIKNIMAERGVMNSEGDISETLIEGNTKVTLGLAIRIAAETSFMAEAEGAKQPPDRGYGQQRARDAVKQGKMSETLAGMRVSRQKRAGKNSEGPMGLKKGKDVKWEPLPFGTPRSYKKP